MPRACTVCAHPDRTEIDKALIGYESTTRIALRLGFSQAAVSRHQRNHVAKVLLKARKAQEAREAARVARGDNRVVVLAAAKEAKEVTHGEDLFAQINDMQVRAIRICDAAEANGEKTVALAAIREVRGNIEMLCRMNAHLQARQRELEEAEEPMSTAEFIKDISLALFGHRGRPEPKPEPESDPED